LETPDTHFGIDRYRYTRDPRSGVTAILAAALLALLCPRAARADTPRVAASARISGGIGAFGELAWSAPGVEAIGALWLGAARRGYVDVRLGFAALDCHTFVSDGRVARLTVGGGARVAERTRVAATLSLEQLFFYSDPDVLPEHPGVDLLAERGGLVPAAGIETSFEVRPALAVGAFARMSLTDIVQFRESETDPQLGDGEEGSAYLILAGLFFEFRVQ
jgi:hypothetical protein